MSDAKASYTIVVAIDYSGPSDLAFERALELTAANPAAELHALHVLPSYQPAAAEVAPGAWSAAMPTPSQAGERLQQYVQQRTRAFRSQHPGRELPSLTRVVAHLRYDAPAEEVAQLAADLEADLVVVGTHGRRGVPRLLLGSVAEGTVRLAPCPVLVVRPKATPAPVPTIEPPCPRCVEARRATAGREFWCEQHRERHGQRHTYHQSDRVGTETNMPLVVRT